MTILAEFSIVPLGKGVSVSPVVARVLKIVAGSGIPYKANPMGTVLEGRVGPGHGSHQRVLSGGDEGR